jgi:sugar phosphate isomerase/epimerase
VTTIIGCTSRPYGGLEYAEAYARIAAAGYTDLAVFGNSGRVPVQADSSPAEVAAVRAAARAAGLRPSMLIGGTQLDSGLEAATSQYRRLIDNAASLGVRWLLDCGTDRQEHFDAYFELMRRMAPHAAAAGLSITLKPHGGITLTAEDMLAAAERVGHPAFGLCFDPGNIVYYTKGARRPETDVASVAPRVTTAIIKDCVVNEGKSDVAVTAGDGLVDFPYVLRALADAGFDGPYYVECVGSSEPDQVDRDVAFTLGYVRGILRALCLPVR